MDAADISGQGSDMGPTSSAEQEMVSPRLPGLFLFAFNLARRQSLLLV